MVSATELVRSSSCVASTGGEDERVGVVAQTDVLGLVEVARAEERRAGRDLHGAERLVKSAAGGVGGKADAAGLRVLDRCKVVENALGGAELVRVSRAEDGAAGERDGALGEAKCEVGEGEGPCGLGLRQAELLDGGESLGAMRAESGAVLTVQASSAVRERGISGEGGDGEGVGLRT